MLCVKKSKYCSICSFSLMNRGAFSANCVFAVCHRTRIISKTNVYINVKCCYIRCIGTSVEVQRSELLLNLLKAEIIASVFCLFVFGCSRMKRGRVMKFWVFLLFFSQPCFWYSKWNVNNILNIKSKNFSCSLFKWLGWFLIKIFY